MTTHITPTRYFQALFENISKNTATFGNQVKQVQLTTSTLVNVAGMYYFFIVKIKKKVLFIGIQRIFH